MHQENGQLRYLQCCLSSYMNRAMRGYMDGYMGRHMIRNMSRYLNRYPSRHQNAYQAGPRRGLQRRLTRVARALFAMIGAMAAAVTLALPSAAAAPAESADFSHQSWSALLSQCVQFTADGNSTAADYNCFLAQRTTLSDYLASLASVSATELQLWSRDEQLAFLINAYNAWTVELILSEWPELESIRDLGSFLRSPWKKSFIPLLGETLSLDDIEHGRIRQPGRFDEPRIHFAVNCASIGCPSLRAEAYTGAQLERQLEDQTQQFLGDPSRNRAKAGMLEVSSIFKWYRDDFSKGWRGANSLAAFLALYGDALGLDVAAKARLREDAWDISFLDYDWRLNAAPDS